MSKRVSKTLFGSYLSQVFAHVIVTFCFEEKESNLVLHVMSD